MNCSPGPVDIALISNSMPYRDGITTIIPLYPTVLHIGQTGQKEFSDFADLIRGSSVFAGPEGSASRAMFEQSVTRLNLEQDEFSFVENQQRPDVVVIFVPIQRNSGNRFSGLRMISMGSPDSIGKGSSRRCRNAFQSVSPTIHHSDRNLRRLYTGTYSHSGR